MAVIVVYTDGMVEVDRFVVDDSVPLTDGNIIARNMIGLPRPPLGWLGRALEDAKIIQLGGDPERPSEKVMRILSCRHQRDRDIVHDILSE